MPKERKKAKRKIKDLETDAATGKDVKGGAATTVGGPAPTRDSLYRRLNERFRPKS